MKLSKLVMPFLLLVSTMNVSAFRSKVVYGDDNRVLAQNSSNSEYQAWSKATVAMISNYNLRFPKVGDKFPDEVTIFDKSNLGDDYGLCKEEKFSKLINPAICSGFLVEVNGEQYVVTAGHCIGKLEVCDDFSWVFGFTSDTTPSRYDDRAFIPKKNVYKCTQIMESSLDDKSQNDYAVIKLDRIVENVVPLKFRKEGKVDSGSELVIIGHPSGIPTIIDDKGSIRKNDNDFFFVANLDSFGGNSGSPVISVDTGLVEGILVRGEDDYSYGDANSNNSSCGVVTTCVDGECRGEDVTRITNIEFLSGKPGPIYVGTDTDSDEEETPAGPLYWEQ